MECFHQLVPALGEPETSRNDNCKYVSNPVLHVKAMSINDVEVQSRLLVVHINNGTIYMWLLSDLQVCPIIVSPFPPSQGSRVES
jgi:hypothetical protein